MWYFFTKILPDFARKLLDKGKVNDYTKQVCIKTHIFCTHKNKKEGNEVKKNANI